MVVGPSVSSKQLDIARAYLRGRGDLEVALRYPEDRDAGTAGLRSSGAAGDRTAADKGRRDGDPDQAAVDRFVPWTPSTRLTSAPQASGFSGKRLPPQPKPS